MEKQPRVPRDVAVDGSRRYSRLAKAIRREFKRGGGHPENLDDALRPFLDRLGETTIVSDIVLHPTKPRDSRPNLNMYLLVPRALDLTDFESADTQSFYRINAAHGRLAAALDPNVDSILKLINRPGLDVHQFMAELAESAKTDILAGRPRSFRATAPRTARSNHP